MRIHCVRVSPLPAWLPWQRLLGPGAWHEHAQAGGARALEADLATAEAADLAARLRGLGFAGRALGVEIEPPLPRAAVRAARLAEARRLRTGSVGFSRPGTQLDAEARRSLTPEGLALELGRRAGGARVLDAACGAGGNAIGFARAGCEVIAVELDPRRLDQARRNARAYDVAERIRFVAGDARELAAQLSADLLFVDPPWGERYDKRSVALSDLPLFESLLALRARFARFWAKVPPSFDPSTIAGARAYPYFGTGEGDARRVKFLLLELD